MFLKFLPQQLYYQRPCSWNFTAALRTQPLSVWQKNIWPTFSKFTVNEEDYKLLNHCFNSVIFWFFQRMNKKNLLCKKLFSGIWYHQILNKYIFAQLFCLSMINSQDTQYKYVITGCIKAFIPKSLSFQLFHAD